MADSNPKFNREAFKRALAHVESSGGKFLENSTSSAVGKYQFLWNNIKSDPSLKGVTKRQFVDSPELQESIMDLALNGKLKGYPNYIENSKKLKAQYGSDLRVDEIALLTHFLGAGGVTEQLKTGAYNVPGENMTVDGYTSKYNKFLQDNNLEARTVEATGRNPKTYNGPVSDADLYAQQAASIGMENQPLAAQPQDNPLTKRLVRPDLQAKLDAMNDLIQGNDDAEADALEDENNSLGPLPLRELRKDLEYAQVSAPQPQNEPNPIAQSINSSLETGRETVKNPSASRIKNMLSPKETDYKGFQNLNRPTDNITESNDYSKGGMIKRADGSYSKRGLWDNIRANKGSGKEPTASMLKQERKINAKSYGGSVDTESSENFVAFEGGGTHEQNSLGGIPQGMGSNGKMNTVEEGETKVTIRGEEYIFSERGQLDGTGFESTGDQNKYSTGGDPEPVAGAGGAAGGVGGMDIASGAVEMVSMGLDMVPEKNANNLTGVEGIQGQKSVGLGAAKGAASGAAAGAVAGPWGMAAGAAIGGAMGLIGSSMANKKAREENLNAFAQANPALQNQNYGGGYLKKKKKGGKLLNPSTKKSRVKSMLRK